MFTGFAMPIDTPITIPEAIKKYGLTEAGLRTMAKDGKIRAGLLSSGKMVVNEQVCSWGRGGE
ncbi:MAG: hypothetical protein ACOYYS_01630 [Chloroflexota bacterium]